MKHILTLEISDVEMAMKDFFRKENVRYGTLEVHSDSDGVFTVSTTGLTLASGIQNPNPEPETQEPESVAEAAAAAETKKDAVDIFGSAI